MRDFKRLKVWDKSHQLVLDIYKITKKFPQDEKFCLAQQMRRAAVSVAANIVEGSKRKSDKDFSHFLNMSEGSLEELKYYFILSRDLNYISDEDCNSSYDNAEEVGKLLHGFVKKLKA